ncbi:hypothetical protein OCK74_12360 [Chitinophagaceae bacterium LB-8]|uniref:Uncharacterized protein n=1 Tax=Paraflavisolibacter caeni TaxID=2982496 RepID=A0A9X2XWE5_9BACT|nr:hypothetical protein [Paraflavisolibacter caeni]MCU7549916.1 hypothetical protein [Paraflavisolibacter caeni]
MKFNSTYEFLVFLRKEGILTAFSYDLNYKSVALALYGKRDYKGKKVLDELLPKETYNKLEDVLTEYCSGEVDPDGEFTSFDYDIVLNDDGTIEFQSECDVNSLFPEEMPACEWLDCREADDIMKKYDDLIPPEGLDDRDDFESEYEILVEHLSIEDSTEEEIIEKITVRRYHESTKKWDTIERNELKKELFDFLCKALHEGTLESGSRNCISIDYRGYVRNDYTCLRIEDDFDIRSVFEDEVAYEIPRERLQVLLN